MIAEHGSLDRYLDATWGDRRLEFCLLLNDNFPPLPGLNYSLAPAVGKVALHPWQLGWTISLGNKGILIADDSKTLVSLIVLQGAYAQFCGVRNLMIVECCGHTDGACPLLVPALFILSVNAF